MIIGLDTETCLIQTGLLAPPLVCYSVSSPNLPELGGLYSHHDLGTLDRILDLVLKREAVLIGHNVCYDLAVIGAHKPDWLPRIFEILDRGQVQDTMLREILLDLEELGRPIKRPLDYLAAKYLYHKLDKDPDGWRLRYSELRRTPIRDWPERAREYAQTDADILIPIFHAQDHRALHSDTFDDSGRQTAWAFALQLMAAWGLKTDVDRIAEIEPALLEDQDLRRQELISAGIMRAKGSIDTKALIEYVTAWHGELPKTDKGNHKKGKDDLLVVCGDDPLIESYLTYKEVGKQLTTYIDKYRSGIVQCSVNPILANGRSSLAKPSLQNLPQRGPVRELFIPRPGKLFASVDYDVVELRTLAQVNLWINGYSSMAQAFQQDSHADLHTVFAAGLLGIDTTEAYRLRDTKDSGLKDARKRAKAANFGFPGGMGCATFVQAQAKQGSHYTLDQAKELKADFLSAYPEMRPYFSHIGKLTAGGRTTIRQFISGRYRGNCSFTQAANGYFSSLMTDGAKHAHFNVARHCYAKPESPLYGARVVCAIHDELLAELDPAGAHEQAHMIADIMCDTMQSKYTPDIPITAAPAIMTRWYKDAEPVYNSRGRLQLWEP